ncbi:hypothetical protein ALP60_200102 [Pseudomonas savastanoi]|uniref:Uncharacterized protein n=1 Tax=Pseudomonas savastanoi TaxID=29438 RepID=A0A3M5F9Z0_PSESS|nr:hypothetical protein ALP60_200102 [Pseudomonas savastanoi]
MPHLHLQDDQSVNIFGIYTRHLTYYLPVSSQPTEHRMAAILQPLGRINPNVLHTI